MTRSSKLSILVFALVVGTTVASPLLAPRAVCMNKDPPDSDLLGLGVRIGLYLQIAALMLAVCCGKADTLSAIPAAIMTAFTLNIILSMKASTRVFDANPVVQDFWVTQCQLFLLVTLLPYMFLFDRWDYRTLGVTKSTLILLAIVYTYVQTFWFWTSGYKNSDEMVCGAVETVVLGHYMIFRDHGRYAILVVYGIGLMILLAMLPNFVRGRTGYFAPVLQRVPTTSDSVRAFALGLACVPLGILVIVMIEQTMRKGGQSAWLKITGQWLSLGVGVFAAAEAMWHMAKYTYRELSGGRFHEEDYSAVGKDEEKGGPVFPKDQEASKDLA